jgi:hypothetical protein
MVGYPEVIQIATWGSIPKSRAVFSDDFREEGFLCIGLKSW